MMSGESLPYTLYRKGAVPNRNDDRGAEAALPREELPCRLQPRRSFTFS
jgi:hypothetical protein